MTIMIDLAVAKTHRYASRESGDTVELVERPGGGVSAVVVDGQGSGAAAKRLSLLVAGRAVSLLSEGVRDGAAARAAHDYLYALRDGRVSAEFAIVSIDLASRSILFTRNSDVPMLVRYEDRVEMISESGGRLGVRRYTRPAVLEYPLCSQFVAILMTDGVAGAGNRSGKRLDLIATSVEVMDGDNGAQGIADRLLAAAIAADRDRPADDMTVVVLQLSDESAEHPIRRLSVSMPVDS